MHLELGNIKAETFPKAEQNLEFIKVLLEYEGAGEIFVQSPDFYTSGINGFQLQRATYFGRYLSFSALMTETLSWRDSHFNIQLHKMRSE